MTHTVIRPLSNNVSRKIPNVFEEIIKNSPGEGGVCKN